MNFSAGRSAGLEVVGMLRPASTSGSSDRPVLTAATLSATVALTASRLWTTAVMHALWRDPAALRRGEIWRLVTPVLVQSDRSIFDVISVFLVSAVVGIAGERYLSRPAWCATYLFGAVSGHALGMAFQPHQSGTSVAFAGVLGGLGALAIWGRESSLHRWRFHAIGLVVLSIADTAVRDIHGVAYLAGLGVGALCLHRGWARSSWSSASMHGAEGPLTSNGSR